MKTEIRLTAEITIEAEHTGIEDLRALELVAECRLRKLLLEEFDGKEHPVPPIQPWADQPETRMERTTVQPTFVEIEVIHSELIVPEPDYYEPAPVENPVLVDAFLSQAIGMGWAMDKIMSHGRRVS